MSTKWKYASLPASERLGMIRNGNKDVYDSEIARAKDVVKARIDAGLDVTEQKKWIDDVSYNYNLYGADRMGISPSLVNQTGYADQIIGSTKSKKKSKTYSTVTAKSERQYKAQSYLEEFYEKVAEAAEKKKNVKEWLLNNGIAEDSDTGKKYLAEFDKELGELAEKYRKEFVSKVKALY